MTGADLASALSEQLAPRVSAEHRSELDTFFAIFRPLALAAGTWLQFDIAEHVVTTEFNGTSLSALNSPAVEAALMDVYLGDSPVSSDFKPSLKKNLKLL